MLVTFLVAIVGIVCALPLGILLALGRRSKLPVLRLFSIIFIEFMRGVPLITVLFMANVMLPLFLPEGIAIDGCCAPLVGITLFSSAYMAEVVRGGLQAMPKGQYEGAKSLGLSYWQMMSLVVLPQALRIVIPGIVNSFIGLFKDTTLVAIVGIFDFLAHHRGGAHRPELGGADDQLRRATPSRRCSTWIFCFGMSRYSHVRRARLRAPGKGADHGDDHDRRRSRTPAVERGTTQSAVADRRREQVVRRLPRAARHQPRRSCAASAS